MNQYMVSWDKSFCDIDARSWAAWNPFDAVLLDKRDYLGPGDDADALIAMIKDGGKEQSDLFVLQDNGDLFIVTIETRLCGFDTATRSPVFVHCEISTTKTETWSIRMVSIGPRQVELAAAHWGDDCAEIGYFLDHVHTDAAEGSCVECAKLEAVGL